uniref:Gamma-aminobutyric acid receptor subunit beta n=1 Tax=Ascaris suum TaxID=6253 RepID=F1LFE7_ASCSU
MDIIIASFDSMSEVNMDYTVTMYLHQFWRDERLSWSPHINIDDMTLSGDFSQHIWVPVTLFSPMTNNHFYMMSPRRIR